MLVDIRKISNEIFSTEDWMPTLLAAAVVTDIKEKLLTGYKAGKTTYKVHLDGYNQLPYLTGQSKESARKEMFYFNDDGSLVALRYNRWKLHFQIQEHHGFDDWQKGWTELRVPMLFDLQADPFERAQHDSEGYKTWAVERIYLLVPAQAYVGKFLMTFKDYPQRQKVGSFSLDRVMESLQKSSPKN